MADLDLKPHQTMLVDTLAEVSRTVVTEGRARLAVRPADDESVQATLNPLHPGACRIKLAIHDRPTAATALTLDGQTMELCAENLEERRRELEQIVAGVITGAYRQCRGGRPATRLRRARTTVQFRLNGETIYERGPVPDAEDKSFKPY